MNREEQVLEIVRSSKVGNISCEEAAIRICLLFNVVGRSEQFCECDGVQDLIAGTGQCRKCGKECTY